MTIREVFDAMVENPAVLRRLTEKGPVHEAVFFALYDFVKKGNDLLSLPWFALKKR
ncbi:MAG: hypothetical protein J6M06_01880 [Synergistaceae bacterium]|nr:hypothetical protein [Synergistaceae bacterium]